MPRDKRSPVTKIRLGGAAALRSRRRSLVLGGLMLAVVPAPSVALDALPFAGPVAADRYVGMFAQPASGESLPPRIDRVETGAIPVATSPVPDAVQGSLRAMFAALDGGDVTRARAIREGMAPGSLDRDIAEWAIALSGRAGVPAAEIDAARRRLGDWPGQVTLANAYERALLRELDGEALIGAFARQKPRTTEGKLALAETARRRDPQLAAKLVSEVWRSETLDAGEERRILSWADDILRRADHDARIAMLVHRDRITAAERIVSRATPGAGHLVRAAAAVARRKNADAALAEVPTSLRSDPIFLYALARHLRRSGKPEAAADTLSGRRVGAREAGDVRNWWEERRALARGLLDRGEDRLAYAVASEHPAERGAVAIDAEFHAGWIALRFLRDAEAARTHFARIVSLGSRSLSLSRGHYWLGRAEEALDDTSAARASFERAAVFRTTFYGQLAMERLGRNDLAIRYPTPSIEERRLFEANRFRQVIERLEGIGEARRARTFYRHLGRTVPTAGQAALLTARAEGRGQFQLGLQLGKVAASRGLDADALAFPTGAIPADAPLSRTGRALAYAIARQESAFDREAVSGAGARGLLQLMPATAREVAGWMDQPYSTKRLTSDPGYNAALGARFLSHLLDRFDNSYVLTAVAYNAGPTRARNWREAYGDPVGRPIDEVVDWIERIPFTETRNYVQRVIENYQVYRARLENRPLRIADDLRFGRSL